MRFYLRISFHLLFLPRLLFDGVACVVHFVSYASCVCCRKFPSPGPQARILTQTQEAVAVNTSEDIHIENAPIGPAPLPFDPRDLNDALWLYIHSQSEGRINEQEPPHTQPEPQSQSHAQVQVQAEHIDSIYVCEDVESGRLHDENSRSSEVSDARHGDYIEVTQRGARTREAIMLMQQCERLAEGAGDAPKQRSSALPVSVPVPLHTAHDHFEYDLSSEDDNEDITLYLTASEEGAEVDYDAEKDKDKDKNVRRPYELRDSDRDFIEEKNSLAFFIDGMKSMDNKKRKPGISKNSEITAI